MYPHEYEQTGSTTLLLKVECFMCKQIYRLSVDTQAYRDWNNGKLIQDAFPEMSKGDRELLISGMCGSCFDKAFKEEEQ